MADKKINVLVSNDDGINAQGIQELVKALSVFPETVQTAAEKYEPSLIARFAVDVAQKFNKFYFNCKILAAEDETAKVFRLALTNATLQTLKNAFALLGIGIPDKM